MPSSLDAFLASLAPDEQAAVRQEAARLNATTVRAALVDVLTCLNDADIMALWGLIAAWILERERDHG